MAFPTSPSNNQVHKEGNRAFVYDSALGVWDQIKETPATIYGTSMNTGSERNLDTSITSEYKRGSIVQVRHHQNSYYHEATGSSWSDISRASGGVAWNPGITPISSNHALLWMFSLSNNCHMNANEGRGTFEIREYIAPRGFAVRWWGPNHLGAYDYGNSGSWVGQTLTAHFMTEHIQAAAADGGTYDGSEIFCRMRYKGAGGSVTIRWNEGVAYSTCTVMEIVI